MPFHHRSTYSGSMMTKIIQFPNSNPNKSEITITADKSDFQFILDRLIVSTKSSARSHGFIAGIAIANVTNIIIQYLSSR